MPLSAHELVTAHARREAAKRSRLLKWFLWISVICFLLPAFFWLASTPVIDSRGHYPLIVEQLSALALMLSVASFWTLIPLGVLSLIMAVITYMSGKAP